MVWSQTKCLQYIAGTIALALLFLYFGGYILVRNGVHKKQCSKAWMFNVYICPHLSASLRPQHYETSTYLLRCLYGDPVRYIQATKHIARNKRKTFFLCRKNNILQRFEGPSWGTHQDSEVWSSSVLSSPFNNPKSQWALWEVGAEHKIINVC